jgi:hypothetical protein
MHEFLGAHAVEQSLVAPSVIGGEEGTNERTDGVPDEEARKAAKS